MAHHTPASRRPLPLRFLSGFLPRDWRDDILEALREPHARRSQGGGVGGGGLWLTGQVLFFALRFAPGRMWEGSGALLSELGQDLRHAVRSTGAAPVYLFAVVLTLGVGIGANTVVFSIVKTVLLEDLPYPDADRLVVGGAYPWTPAPVVAETFAVGNFAATAAYYPQHYVLTVGEDPYEVEGVHVTAGFFSLFGARMALGRDFHPSDEAEGRAVVVLSHGAWQRRFGGDTGIIGRTVGVNGEPHEMIGVVEQGFRQLTPQVESPELWTPGRLEALGPRNVAERWAIPLARLPSELSLEGAIEQAGVTLRSARGRFQASEPDAADGPPYGLHWTPLRDNLTAGPAPALGFLQATVGLLLLLACVNVANLVLARFGARSAEVAVRTALGASRGRIVRQFLTESLALAFLGGLVGVVLALPTLELVLRLAPPGLPRIDAVGLDGGVLSFAVAVSLSTGALFGLLAAWSGTRGSPRGILQHGARTTGSRGRHRVGRGLATLQVALTVLLLAGAGLSLRSLTLLTARDPGFRTQDVLVVRVNVEESRFPGTAELDDFYVRAVEGLEAVPGVQAVGVSNRVPTHRAGSSREYQVEGESGTRVAHYGVVGPGTFRVLGLPLLGGRYLEAADGPGSPPVVVVDRALRDRVWPGEDAVGKRILHAGEWRTVVGVVEGVRGEGLASEPEPGFYIPHRQRPDTPTEFAVGRSAVLLVHAPGGGADLVPALRQALLEVDRRQPVAEATTLSALLVQDAAPQRFRALLLGAFAVIALVLAAAGIYGVVGQLLVERMHEFGIRRALGATGASVAAGVLSWGMALTLPGLAMGVGGLILLRRQVEGFLFAVEVTDPVTLVGVVALVAAMALIACAAPALRAMRVDPGVTLRGG